VQALVAERGGGDVLARRGQDAGREAVVLTTVRRERDARPEAGDDRRQVGDLGRVVRVEGLHVPAVQHGRAQAAAGADVLNRGVRPTEQRIAVSARALAVRGAVIVRRTEEQLIARAVLLAHLEAAPGALQEDVGFVDVVDRAGRRGARRDALAAGDVVRGRGRRDVRVHRVRFDFHVHAVDQAVVGLAGGGDVDLGVGLEVVRTALSLRDRVRRAANVVALRRRHVGLVRLADEAAAEVGEAVDANRERRVSRQLLRISAIHQGECADQSRAGQ